MLVAPLLLTSLLFAAPPSPGIEQAGNPSIQTQADTEAAQKIATKATAILRRKGYDVSSTNPDALLSITSDPTGTVLAGAIVIRKSAKWASTSLTTQGRDCFQGRLAAKLNDAFLDQREGNLADVVVVTGRSPDAAASDFVDAVLAKLAETK